MPNTGGGSMGDALSGGVPLVMPTKRRMSDDAEFMDWYVPLAKKLHINPNPDDPSHYYDYESFYRDMKAGKAISPDKPGGHFPSTYKTEGHPRTYLPDSMGRVFDTRSAKYLKGGRVSERQLKWAERSADMPGFNPEMAKALAPMILNLKY
jgi:hypothetical protein